MSPTASILLKYWEEHQETSLLQSVSLTLLIFVLLLIFTLIITFKSNSHTETILNLPPSPPNKLPIIGHLHQLGTLPHHSLQSLAQRHGPLMMIHLGSSPTLVVSSPQAAKEIMKTHDLIFSSRPKQTFVAKRFFYDHKDLAFIPYGEYWRQMRRICILQLLSAKRVQSFRSVREEETKVMIQKINGSTSCNNSQVVNLSEIIITLTNDIICRVVFGRKYSGEQIGKRFGVMIAELVYLMGIFHVGDFIPWLGWTNHFYGLNARTEKCFREMDGFLEGVIEDHIESKKKRECSTAEHEYKEDLVDVLLGINDIDSSAGLNFGGSLGRDNIKAIILDMFSAGTDTSYSVLEWAMAELIRNPQIMKQAQDEVREIAKGKVNITEDDLNKLYYLQYIIKETLRLHPPAPLLLPRESTDVSTIQGYDVPAKTRVLINAYAIGRDPKSWKEPNKFEAERFMNSSVEFKGHDFEFIPFGSGRRGCPGIAFATATIELALPNLLFRFDWKLAADGNGEERDLQGHDLDMTESSGLAVHKKSILSFSFPYSLFLWHTRRKEFALSLKQVSSTLLVLSLAAAGLVFFFWSTRIAYLPSFSRERINNKNLH